MFEFHGWVTIQGGCCEAQDDALLEENVNQIRNKTKQLAIEEFGCEADISVSNGLYRLTIHGFRNHTQPWVLERVKRDVLKL